MASAKSIDLSDLRRLVEYDLGTGLFKRKERPLSESYMRRSGVKKRQDDGKVIGYLRPDGYVEVSVDGKIYLAHRLAWFYVTGAWPVAEIDHKDTVRHHNAFDNLREATPAQNQANRKVGKSSSSGIKCVVQTSTGWGAYIVASRKFRWLGTFPSAELASAAYELAARQRSGEFARAA